MYNWNMKLLFAVALLLLAFPCHTLNSEIQQSLPSSMEAPITNTPDPQVPEQYINEQYLQRTDGAAIDQETDGSLNQWVEEQLKAPRTVEGFHNMETFIVALLPSQSFQFKWEPALSRNRRDGLVMLLQVFTSEFGDDMVLNHNPQKESYVQVQAKSQFTDAYLLLGQVYVSKEIKLNFYKDRQFIKLTNFNDIQVLLQVNMEQQMKDLSVIKDDFAKNKDFHLPSEKLSTIFKEFKSNEKSRFRMFKWQWGFLEREERYDQQMLKLTAVQLLVILVTTIVQMYCIKSLLDRKQII